MDSMQRAKYMLYVIYTVIALLCVGVPTTVFMLYQQHTYPEESLQLGSYLYPNSTESCEGENKIGIAGITNDLVSQKGFRYHVRTPSNYNAQVAHPLLVVFAPSVSGTLMEKYTGLTLQATELGMVVAYVDGRRLSLETIDAFGQIPDEIMGKWCIDTQRVFLTGHSDGGTTSSALVFLGEERLNKAFRPAAIAPSAAGITEAELKQYTCQKPLSVMVMHNDGDTHFPDFGRQAADWWASCNQCGDIAEKPAIASMLAAGCVQYSGCANGVETYYCEGKGGSHLTWPRLNAPMLDLFLRSPAVKFSGPAVKLTNPTVK